MWKNGNSHALLAGIEEGKQRQEDGEFKASPGKVSKTLSQKRNTNKRTGWFKRPWVLSQHHKKTKLDSSGGVTQVVEHHLPSKCKDLSSNSSAASPPKKKTPPKLYVFVFCDPGP
jgi:hypothetical protein